MSAINALCTAYYTAMANNAAMSFMGASNARIGMLNYADNVGSIGALTEKDTQLELQMLADSLRYRSAKAMLRSLKEQQEEENKEKLNYFA
ncbi:MAG: hypothetical protein MJ237_00685 [bacterium]|nr:hypothetical protein [bacterium]